MADALTFDGADGRDSFFSSQKPTSSVTQLTIRGQDIDEEFVRQLESFCENQKGINAFVFDACEFSSNDFHFLTHLDELENFAMTNCSVGSEMARVVLANLNGHSVTHIDFSGNSSLDKASKAILTGKFAGRIIWGDGTSAFE